MAALAGSALAAAALEMGGGGTPRDLSPWSMFLHADAVVQAVVPGLALASVITWALLFGKGAAPASGTAQASRALGRLSPKSSRSRVW